MIMISENAAPRNSWGSESSVQLQEAKVSSFSFFSQVICSINMISVSATSIKEKGHRASINKNIFTHLLVIS